MGYLLKLGIAILVGLLGGKIANKFKLPNVSGYIIAGLLLGPSLFKLISASDMEAFGIINDVALGLISFGIGNEFLLSSMRKIGKDSFIITVAEVFGTVIIVFLTMHFIFGKSIPFSLVIASMSAATEPAGLVMVIKELRAGGPLVRTILSVAAFDDALGVMVFGISLSVAKMSSGVADYTLLQIIGNPLLEILGAMVLGLVLGVILTYFINKARGREELMIVTLGFILFGIGFAKYIGISDLLTCMVMGGTVVNSTDKHGRVFDTINEFTPPINLLFFTLAGASLDIRVVKTVGLLGLGFILARAIGKVLGAGLGARAVDASDQVKKYLGASLFPLGGISIGLSVSVANELPDLGTSIVSVILLSVLVFQVFGPILAKLAIIKSGEAGGMKKDEGSI